MRHLPFTAVLLAACSPGQLEHDAARSLGDVELGQFRDYALVLTNGRTEALALTFELTPGDFTAMDTSRTLAAGETTTLLIRFRPAELGVREATLLIHGPQESSEVALSGRGTGPRLSIPAQLSLPAVAIVGTVPELTTSTLMLLNAGTAGSGLKLDLPRVEGQELCVGTFFRSVCQPWLPPDVVEAGVSVEVPISLLATTPGPRRWNVVFPSNDVLHPEVVVEVVALVESSAPCVLSLPVGVVLVDTPVEFRITHTGPGTCLLRDVTLSSTPAGAFTFGDDVVFPVRLDRGTSVSRMINLGPPPGPSFASGLVHVVPAGAEPVDVTVLLQRPPTQCLVPSPEALDFGVLANGCISAERSVQLYNVCGRPLTITSVALAAPDAGAPAEFSLAQAIPAGTVIAPGMTPVNLSLRYRPLDLGADTGVLRITTIEYGEVLVGLSGRGDPVGQNVDTFRQDDRAVADVLVMVDSSPSFVPRRAEVRANLSGLLSFMGSRCVDARWAFAAAEGAGDAGVQLLTNDAGARWTSTLEADFVGRALSSFDSLPIGTEVEACVGPAAALLQDAGVRDGGFLVGLCLTDALEQSPNPLAALSAIRAQRAPGFFSWSTVNAVATSSCPVEAVDDGVHATLVAAANGGVSEDICNSTWWQNLVPLGGWSPQGCVHASFFLTNRPSGPLEVRVGGQLVPGIDWTYDAVNNSVVFVAGREPGPGQSLQVSYATACGP